MRSTEIGRPDGKVTVWSGKRPLLTIDLNLPIYHNLIRPVLFRFPPELSYDLAIWTLKFRTVWRALGAVNSFTSPTIRTSIAGIQLENPVGLAAGFDKYCEILPSLSHLGFGYVSCGTVTREPRKGNPSPRLLRYESCKAIVNSKGFPNDGLEVSVERIAEGQFRRSDTPIIVSVSGTNIDDIVMCHRQLEPLVDAVEINISSPNTKGLRLFHKADVLAELLAAVSEQRSRPLFVKMPPFPERGEGEKIHDRVLSLAEVCVSAGVEALTVANTWPVSDPRLGIGSGGLSGKPIYGAMLQMVSEIRSVVGDSVAINACGGIFTAEDARDALRAGADTVQLLTGMVYRGPCVAPEIAKGLSKLVSEEKLTSVRDLRTEASAAQLVRI